jgi:polyhydroxybutyrate depolymerase
MKSAYGILACITAALFGTAAAEASGSWVSFAVEGREVDAFVPACAGGHSPIILSLHAWSTNKNVQKGIDQYSQHVGPECAVIVYPQGKFRGYLFGATGYSWNAGGCCPDASSKHVDDVRFLQQVISETSRTFKVNSNLAFVSGASNGGMMANRLACSDERIKALVSVGGPLINGTGGPDTETFVCHRQVPILHFHGLSDPIVPFGGCNTTVGGDVCTFLERLGDGKFAPMSSIPTYMDQWKSRNGVLEQHGTISFQNHTCTCTSWGESASNVTLCTLKDEGHAWPGSCSIVNTLTSFLTRCTLDIDASLQAMTFFRRYVPMHNVLV